MQLTNEERQRWQAAETPAARKAIIREVRRRSRAERHSDDNIDESFIAWADRILKR